MFKVLWHHKIIAIIVLTLTVGGAAAAYYLTPRVFEATASYAIVNPDVPTSEEIQKDSALAQLNSDNPFLRSSDSSLIAQVMVTKLNSDAIAEGLEDQGLSENYEVAQGGSYGPGLLIDIKGEGESEESAIKSVTVLGEMLDFELYAVQKVNDADDTYLYEALQIDAPDRAIEQYSDKLRLVIVVVVAGFALLFAAVASARAIEQARKRRDEKSVKENDEDDDLRSPFGSDDLAVWKKPVPTPSAPSARSVSSPASARPSTGSRQAERPPRPPRRKSENSAER